MSEDWVLPDTGKEPFTDYSKWRLKADDTGRHTWHYLDSQAERQEWPQSVLDRYWLGLDTGLPKLETPNTALEAAKNGFEFYRHLQAPDGHWPGEYGGPMFLIAGLVIGSYVSGMWFTEPERREMIRYIFNRAHPEDGGWGLHVEGPSTVFGTTCNYVALRLLGVPPSHSVTARARETLRKLGGATGIPAWGKFWLSILNVYDWEGNNVIPPELWLIPEWLPLHPHRWWVQMRNVFIPMSYLWGIRFKAPENALILALREEIYNEPYSEIQWRKCRNHVAPGDIYYPHSMLFNALFGVLGVYDDCAIPPIRQAGLQRVYRLIVQEDENTSYQTIGPVSKMMNLVARTHVEGVGSKVWKQHMVKRQDFMWLGPEGMMMSGTNGSQLWDTAFIAQALVETGLASKENFRSHAIKALEWLDDCQIKQDPIHFQPAYRHTSKGAWPFSTRENSYTVSDCTGEGLKAVIYLQEHLSYTPERVSKHRLRDAVDVLLSMQNKSGGFASYERIRGPAWLEQINAAEVFGNIMIECDYPECTTSVITALAIFRKQFPTYRRSDIEKTIKRAVKYLHNCQTPDGVWFGSWAICFTYATQFALESLSLMGETYENSPAVRKACDYLVSKQMEDGGWGESYKACETGVWVNHEKSQVTQTSWAVMALIYASYPHREPIERGVKLVMSRQLQEGSWAQEAIEGIFNRSCAIAYPNFKFSFTIWMLGRAHHYLKELDTEK